MPMLAGVGDRFPQQPIMSEAFAKDAIIAWFRGEFAAANSIIDALCGHLTQMEGGDAAAEVYKSAFAAIHRRRMNWIPILQMQKYFPTGDVTTELNKVAEKKKKKREVIDDVALNAKLEEEEEKKNLESPVLESNENGGGELVDEDYVRDETPESEITDTGSQEVQHFPEHVDICSNHEECESRHTQIKLTKGFVAKEPVKGHMVNVVRGLKLYEDIFTDDELSKLNNFVNELRVAGQNGELSGETFILYNQQVKGNKRELIQFGVPIFGRTKEGTTNKFPEKYIEPIPALLQGVIDHLSQWDLISESRKPNSCIINFFDEGEFSQPFLKPPHLEQPLSTLLLSESRMGFGRSLVSDSEGNYKGPLMLSLNKGSLLVMRGNSSDTARHVMCSSQNKRVSITFFRVRTERGRQVPEMSPSSKAMTLWQPNNYEQMNMMPKWGLVHAPMVMLAPVRPMVVNPRRIQRGGTGVFLPWSAGTRKPAKHLPPRAQRARFLALPSPVQAMQGEISSDSGANSP